MAGEHWCQETTTTNQFHDKHILLDVERSLFRNNVLLRLGGRLLDVIDDRFVVLAGLEVFGAVLCTQILEYTVQTQLIPLYDDWVGAYMLYERQLMD